MYRKNCYCCAKPSNSDAMDVDAALHELGMLSSSTESRKQFLSERNRTKSESATTSMLRKATESANANQNGYQIIEINPTFVTGFMSEIVHPCAESSSSSSSSQQSPPRRGNYSGYVPRALGNSYRNEPDSLEKDVKLHRLARIKLGRQRRFRKPYEVPWRLHHSLPLPDTQPDSPIDNRPPDSSELSIDTTTTTAGAVTSPTSAPSKSNNSSPVKIPTLVIHRSKSLDDLDLARLKISELTQDQNFISQRQEIDQMSQNFKDLQMKE